MTTNANERDAAADLAVCEAATEGPWEPNEWYGSDEGGWAAIGPHHMPAEDADFDTANEPDGPTHERAKADSAFIAIARTALPHWIKERNAERARAAELERQLAGARGALTDLNNQLRVNVEHLNVVLAERDEAREQLADARSLVALKQQDVDSLSRAFADERRARELAESAIQLHVDERKDLRERGEALATAGLKLRETLSIWTQGASRRADIWDISREASSAYYAALAAWREIAPAKPEKEKDNG